MPRVKREKSNKKQTLRTRQVLFRITPEEYSKLEQMATLYTEGNVSRWIRCALKNYRPRKSDLEFV